MLLLFPDYIGLDSNTKFLYFSVGNPDHHVYLQYR